MFLLVLDPEAYADVGGDGEPAGAVLSAPQQGADALFPEKGADAEWLARKVFTKRIPHSIDFRIEEGSSRQCRRTRGMLC
jgi:hypothetical protein